MRSRNTSDKLRSQQIMEEPAKEGLIEEQVKFEIGRLTVILRNPVCTEEEKARNAIAVWRLPRHGRDCPRNQCGLAPANLPPCDPDEDKLV
jgi:hypothetical protein